MKNGRECECENKVKNIIEKKQEEKRRKEKRAERRDEVRRAEKIKERPTRNEK